MALLKQNKLFFVLYGLLLLAGIAILTLLSKGEGFKLLNLYHNKTLDVIFFCFTVLGNGWFMIILTAICLMFKRKHLGILIISSFAFSGVIVYVLKKVIDSDRPRRYFQDTDYRFMFDLNELLEIHSFPSGHTTSAFALAAVLSFYFRNKKLAIILIVYACLVGYSRIYLAQHFLVDVVCGSLIGVISAMICWQLTIWRRSA